MRSFDRWKLPPPQNSFVFDLEQDYSLEIGAGVGLHAIRKAQNAPNTVHIAIERTKDKFAKLQNRQKSHGLENLIVVHDDAINWLCHNGLPNCINRIFIPYPNPYMKNKNARFPFMPFNHWMLSCLKPQGLLEFRTNISQYQTEILEEYVDTWGLKLLVSNSLEKNQLTNDYKATTHFEKKYLERGETCFLIQFLKPSF
ncbi:MAG: SAM-dependent methyltransferase [Bdellovibrionales bacterium]